EAGGEERPAVGGPECGGDHRPVAAAPQVVEDVVDVVDRQRAEVVEGRRHVGDPGVTLPGPHPQAGGSAAGGERAHASGTGRGPGGDGRRRTVELGDPPSRRAATTVMHTSVGNAGAGGARVGGARSAAGPLAFRAAWP